MKETKTTTPTWVEDMQKWQRENKEQRAVFCVTSSEKSFGGMLFGCNLPILVALVKLMEEDSDYKDLISTAKEAIDNPISNMLVCTKWEEFKKEYGIKNHDEAETSDDSSMKSFLKGLFQTLANKL